jgi:hypothetical protein
MLFTPDRFRLFREVFRCVLFGCTVSGRPFLAALFGDALLAARLAGGLAARVIPAAP